MFITLRLNYEIAAQSDTFVGGLYTLSIVLSQERTKVKVTVNGGRRVYTFNYDNNSNKEFTSIDSSRETTSEK